MSSLDVRAYVLKVEEHLKDRLRKGERKLALREVKGVVRDLAFDLAIRKRRPAPADIDYALALECLKPPETVAEVLVARRSEYASRVRRRRLRSVAVLAVLILGGLALANAMTAQVSHDLATLTVGTPPGETVTWTNRTNFTVPEGLDRLDYDIRTLVTGGEGTARVTIMDPNGRNVFQREVTRDDKVYHRGNLEATPGKWFVFVDLTEVSGSVRVDVTGVGPQGS